MVKILKYPFDIADEVTLNMPENSRVLSVQLQDNRPTLWAMVSTEMPMENRIFKIYDTGEELANGSTPKKYIGTLQMDGFVKHIFEK